MEKKKRVIAGIVFGLLLIPGMGYATVSNNPLPSKASEDAPHFTLQKNATGVIASSDWAEKSISDLAFEGFHSAKVISSNHFIIHIEKDVDVQQLTMRVVAPFSLKTPVTRPDGDIQTIDFSSQLNLLYLAVSEIMDIHLKHFKINVVVCKNSESLQAVSERFFDTVVQAGGFFVPALNTLYVDAESVNTLILGHEIAHAIQIRYFATVLPPPKIQEMLSSYAEYELRKCASPQNL